MHQHGGRDASLGQQRHHGAGDGTVEQGGGDAARRAAGQVRWPLRGIGQHCGGGDRGEFLAQFPVFQQQDLQTHARRAA